MPLGVALADVFRNTDAQICDREPKLTPANDAAVSGDVRSESIPPVLQRVVAEFADRHVDGLAPVSEHSGLTLKQFNGIRSQVFDIVMGQEAAHSEDFGIARSGRGSNDRLGKPVKRVQCDQSLERCGVRWQRHANGVPGLQVPIDEHPEAHSEHWMRPRIGQSRQIKAVLLLAIALEWQVACITVDTTASYYDTNRHPW